MDKSQFINITIHCFIGFKLSKKFLRSNLSLIFAGYYMGVLRDTIPIRKENEL